ncbi:MAG: pyridoxamine 5'-phosphate oxidase family protein [Treponema sp.]|nr:pyridoxamine 5'-phosphate oxidase family protein [Treponema sp.]
MKPMRRKDREISAEEALAVVDKCVYAVLSTVNEDLSPYGTPLSIVRDGGEIYFHCAREGRKIENLARDSRVCLVCVGDTREPPDNFTVEYESAVVFGKAREITGDGEKMRVLRLICERHTPANMAAFETEAARGLAATSVWGVSIDGISGKRNPGRGAEKPRQT